MASAVRPVYIYESGSILPACAQQFHKKFDEFNVDPSRVVRVHDSSYLRRELDRIDQGALVMPGSYNSFNVADQIRENGLDQRIKRAVDRGWSYLGSCAGANLAAHDMLIDSAHFKGKASDVNIPFLDLLPVDASIPVYPIEKWNSQGGSNGRIIPVETLDGESFQTYWNEGSSFRVLNPSAVKSEVLYADISSKPVAAVSGTYGKGPVVAMGIHPEFVDDSSSKEVSEDSVIRKKFMRKMFDTVQITKPEDK